MYIDMFNTTTPKGLEGHNISYSEELACFTKLKKVLPEGWTVKFDWSQILFADVQYQIDKRKKLVAVQYNQNLRIWASELVAEVESKIKATPAKT